MKNKNNRFEILGDVKITFNDPEYAYDYKQRETYWFERLTSFENVENDGGVEDWGNYLLEM